MDALLWRPVVVAIRRNINGLVTNVSRRVTVHEFFSDEELAGIGFAISVQC